GAPLWMPGERVIEAANITGYLRWLRREIGRDFGDYHALWRWSTPDLAGVWASIWRYYGLGQVSGYDRGLGPRTLPGAQWFPGAKLNFARECLRHASDQRPAILFVPEAGAPVEISWAGLRAEVASVAAALREFGVRPGDRVAAYLPNIPHAVVAMLAT